MNALVFYIFYVINWVIMLLPLRILYILSDIIFLIFYYFPGYRKKIVMSNLKNSFPEKSTGELKAIQKKFYRHLSDIIIEILKITHLGKQELLKRCVIENIEVLNRLYSEGRNVVGVMGHYNNWEYMSAVSLMTDYKCIVVYKPLKNKYFDKYLLRLRTKNNVLLSPMSHVMREVISRRNSGEKILIFLLTDQTPAKEDINYWTTFLNQETPVYLGAGKISSKYNMAVVFVNQRKIKRGYYSVKLEILLEETANLTEEEITEFHVRRLEKMIMEKPENWLWSHRRWKHKRVAQDG